MSSLSLSGTRTPAAIAPVTAAAVLVRTHAPDGCDVDIALVRLVPSIVQCYLARMDLIRSLRTAAKGAERLEDLIKLCFMDERVTYLEETFTDGDSHEEAQVEALVEFWGMATEAQGEPVIVPASTLVGARSLLRSVGVGAARVEIYEDGVRFCATRGENHVHTDLVTREFIEGLFGSGAV